jgi:hypothetical protein
MDGSLKLVGCRGWGSNWHFRLFDVARDPGETTDLFRAHLPLVDQMYKGLAAWMESVSNSREQESQCSQQP